MEGQNPYTLVFGKEPNEIIPRIMLKEDIIQEFSAEQPSQHVSIITGIRGSGKTVFMTEICNQLKKNNDWIVVELNPERDLLEGLLSKLGNNSALRSIFRQAKINLSYFGISIQVEGVPPVSDVEVALTQMLENLGKHHKRVLIAIDEVISNQAMKEFAAAYQIFLRQDLQVFLLMTGLYENIHALQDQKSLTFLYRAPRITLGPLNMSIIADNYERVFKIDRKAAWKMAGETKGYSFAFQVLGYFTWKYPEDPEYVKSCYKQYLIENVYEKVWDEMSPGDRKLAEGIARVKSGNVGEIKELLNMESNRFNPYRIRLIRKGIVDGSVRGELRFLLPLFDEFILDRGEEWNGAMRD